MKTKIKTFGLILTIIVGIFFAHSSSEQTTFKGNNYHQLKIAQNSDLDLGYDITSFKEFFGGIVGGATLTLQRFEGNVAIGTRNSETSNLLTVGPNPDNFAGNDFVISSETSGMSILCSQDFIRLAGTKDFIFLSKNPPERRKIGINTEAPQRELDLHGSFGCTGDINLRKFERMGNNTLLVDNNGDVFIDTTKTFDGPVGWQNSDGSYTHQIWKDGKMLNQKIDGNQPTVLETKVRQYFEKRYQLDYDESAKRVAEKYGIQETPKEKVKTPSCSIFPNSFSNWFEIVFPENVERQVKIYDLSGKFFDSYNFTTGEKAKINGGNLSPGTYLVSINGRTCTAIKK